MDPQCETGLGHVCPQTIFTALNERGLKCYREQYKFILKPEGRAQCLAYCQARKDWLPDKEWANIAFTDKMSIEIGGSLASCRFGGEMMRSGIRLVSEQRRSVA